MPYRPATLARNGIVCAPHYLASQAGLALLQAGGNAVDAAIAANAVLNVVYPILCGLGGDLFMLIYHTSSGELAGLDACGAAGSLADVAWFRERGYEAVPQRSALAVTVPGVVDGWQMASDRFGRLGLARCLEPAIGYAEQGFGVTPYLHRSLARTAAQDWPHASWRAVYQPGGRVPAAGSVLRVPELARSLRLIAQRGRDAFYKGEIGDALAAFMQEIGGLITRDDIAAHHGRWVQPLAVAYRGCTVYELPPPTQGVTALGALGIQDGLTLHGALTDVETVHLLVETKKLAFADRARYLGDPAAMTIDPAELLRTDYLAERRAQIDPARAREAEAGALSGDTIYLCAADGEGNVVSLIQSNYMGVGAGLVVPGYGVELHNRGCYFNLQAGHPNCIAPGKRPLHTLIPSMAFKDGRPVIALGTQGGDGQPQIQQQLYAALLDFGLDVQEAVELPRWVHGRGQPGDPPGLQMEERFPPETVARLRALGHDVVLIDGWSPAVGQAQAIVIDPESGLLAGAADPRADGSAAGW